MAARASSRSLSLSVQTPFKIHNGLDDRPERRNLAEYHLGHCVVILLEVGQHSVMRYQGVASRSSGCEVEVRPIEEHARVPNAIGSHGRIC